MSCLRRSWLLRELSNVLECNCRADGRLYDLLALADGELLKALAGRRVPELQERYAHFRRQELAPTDGIAEVCRCDPRYPRTLQTPTAPALLFATGGLQRLGRLTAGPVVAIVGTRKATDYGIEIARGLARGLAASGIAVATELADGIARAAQTGALEAGGATVAVLPGGLDVATPARQRSLLRRIEHRGCAVSELPRDTLPRRWTAAAAERTVASLASTTIVVEAKDGPRELAAARLAQTLGRTVAAVPGRVTSRASCGNHALLREGARLVTGPADVLDLLYGAEPIARATHDPYAALAPRLRSVLEDVGAGMDTPEKLRGRGEPGELLHALSELELIGLLARGDGGRYVPCSALGAAAVRYGPPSQMEP
jgi:DNA processing protein